MGLPGITSDDMREVDRLMIEEYHIHVELMIEHAGLNLVRRTVRLGNNKANMFLIIAGSGNNGGGALVAARPSDVYRHKLGINWVPPFNIDKLNKIDDVFRKNSLQKVLIHKKDDPDLVCWNVQ